MAHTGTFAQALRQAVAPLPIEQQQVAQAYCSSWNRYVNVRVNPATTASDGKVTDN
jgi:hypothetical protein